VEGSCEEGNEHSGGIKCGVFFLLAEQLQSNSVITSRKGLHISYRYKRVLL
jgi:hypothetical protein